MRLRRQHDERSLDRRRPCAGDAVDAIVMLRRRGILAWRAAHPAAVAVPRSGLFNAVN
jgi:hypothetical protein